MTSKKINIGKRYWSALIFCYFIPPSVVIALYLSSGLNLDDIPLDNAKYFYSAVFQGFAALLALAITAVLITLQNMNSQRHNIEERIYKILGKRAPAYIPGTIKEIEQDMEDCLLNTEFRAYVKKNSEFPLEKQELFVKRITNELKSMFAYLDYWENHKSDLHMFFGSTTLFNISVLFCSAIALIFADSHDVLGVNSSFVLIFDLILVMITIEFLVLYIFKIIQAWTTQPENS